MPAIIKVYLFSIILLIEIEKKQHNQLAPDDFFPHFWEFSQPDCRSNAHFHVFFVCVQSAGGVYDFQLNMEARLADHYFLSTVPSCILGPT